MRGGRGLSNIFFLHVEIMENISFFLALTLAMINIDKERASVLETEEPLSSFVALLCMRQLPCVENPHGVQSLEMRLGDM